MDEFIGYKIIKESRTKTIRLRLLSNGVIHYSYIPNSTVCELEHQVNHDAIVKFSHNIKHLVIVDTGEFLNLTSKARILIRKLEETVPVTARAVVVKTLGERMIINFYISFHKPIIPTKVFSNHENAMIWLNKKNLSY
jgi:hypothetical protein